jgi:hypothetical protein
VLFCVYTPILGQQSQIPIHPSNCLVTSLKLDKGRKALLERKKRIAKQKNKHREGAAAGLDWGTALHLQGLLKYRGGEVRRLSVRCTRL